MFAHCGGYRGIFQSSPYQGFLLQATNDPAAVRPALCPGGTVNNTVNSTVNSTPCGSITLLLTIGNGFWSGSYPLGSPFWGIPAGKAATAQLVVMGGTAVVSEGRKGESCGRAVVRSCSCAVVFKFCRCSGSVTCGHVVPRARALPPSLPTHCVLFSANDGSVDALASVLSVAHTSPRWTP